MRVLAFITAAVFGVAGGACSGLLGIEDPTPDFGPDGRTLVAISIEPDPLSLPVGATQQLTATGMFDDGSMGDITAQTEFSVESGAAITVTPMGLAKGVAEGAATVSAKLGRISGSLGAQVLPAAPDHLVFGIGDFRIAQLQRVRLHAFAVLTDGMMQDATANATYETDNPAVAVVSAPGQVDGGSQAGMATISARLGAARAGTVKATVMAKQCRPVINEFQAGGATGSDEWVEILNPCTGAVDVAGWTLVYRAATTTGATDTNLMMTLTGQMAPGEIRLYAGQDYAGANDGKWTTGGSGGIMQANNGGIALRMGPQNTGPIADALAYGTVTGGHPFIEANALPAMMNGKSAQRLPFDGRDGDDGAADFMQVQTASPRAPNAP